MKRVSFFDDINAIFLSTLDDVTAAFLNDQTCLKLSFLLLLLLN